MVNIWCGDGLLRDNGLPKSTDEYFHFIEKEFEFLKKEIRG